jgi:DNA-binding NarL/FixJ family response regulator
MMPSAGIRRSASAVSSHPPDDRRRADPPTAWLAGRRPAGDDATAGCDPCDAATLTPRQLEVLRLLTTGMTNRHIGRALGITEKTVKNHMQAIFTRLSVADRTQAALYAVRHRLTT